MGGQILGDEGQLRAGGWEVGAGGKQRCLLPALHCGTRSTPAQDPSEPVCTSSHPLLPLAFTPPAITRWFLVEHGLEQQSFD